MRIIIGIIAIVVAIALFFLFINRDILPFGNQGQVPLQIDLQTIKPTTWKPFYDEGLKNVDIDGDDVAEWLFIYYNQGDTGHIGGVIYDAQNRPQVDNSVAIPQQTSAYLIPYPLMPDYSPGKNQGYLGDDDIQIQGVYTDPARKPEGDSGAIKGDRLQFRGIHRGKTSYFSTFWWIDQQSGYGGALAYTPGWFSTSRDDPNWPNWDSNSEPTYVTTLWAWEPQMDRSNTCRRVQWQLEGVRFVADYANSDLMFCSGFTDPNNGLLLTDPAFPEAQVLAYLIDGNTNRWKAPDAAFQVSAPATVLRISEPEITDQPADQPVSTVDVDFIMDNVERHMVWTVAMQSPTSINDTVHWRITGARDR